MHAVFSFVPFFFFGGSGSSRRRLGGGANENNPGDGAVEEIHWICCRQGLVSATR